MLVRRASARMVRSGFTLMEMMVVVAIIVALAGMGYLVMSGRADDADEGRARGDMKNILDAAEIYRLKTKQYPTSVDELVNANLLKAVPVTPWGGAYQIGTDERGHFMVGCATPRGNIQQN